MGSSVITNIRSNCVKAFQISAHRTLGFESNRSRIIELEGNISKLKRSWIYIKTDDWKTDPTKRINNEIQVIQTGSKTNRIDSDQLKNSRKDRNTTIYWLYGVATPFFLIHSSYLILGPRKHVVRNQFYYKFLFKILHGFTAWVVKNALILLKWYRFIVEMLVSVSPYC